LFLTLICGIRTISGMPLLRYPALYSFLNKRGQLSRIIGSPLNIED